MKERSFWIENTPELDLDQDTLVGTLKHGSVNQKDSAYIFSPYGEHHTVVKECQYIEDEEETHVKLTVRGVDPKILKAPLFCVSGDIMKHLKELNMVWIYPFNEDLSQPTITFRPFLLSRNTVSQKLWEEHMIIKNRSQFKGENRPVEHVSYYNAREYARRLTDHTGVPFRLPTVDEWCTAFSYPDEVAIDILAHVSCQDANIYGVNTHTVDVDSHSTEPFGLCHMLGNVWEWCNADLSLLKYDLAPICGGAWNTLHRGALFSAHIHKVAQLGNQGFRLAV